MVKKSRFREIVSSNKNIIKDAEYFKVTYTPIEIIERKETFELYRELSVFTKYRKPNNILLKGFPGSGKTVTINFIIKELNERFKDIDVLYANCDSKSSSSVLKVLTGDSTKNNFSNLMGKFLDLIKKDTIIILDEIDRSNKIESLLYSLSRPNEINKSFNKNISFILVSNHLRWEDTLRDNIRSSLQLKQIIFNPYSEHEIKNILKDRIKNGFHNIKAISNELLELIARIISKEKRGDCRVAIEALFYSAQLSESRNRNEIIQEDVRQALKIAINKSDKSLISKLKDNQLLVLYLVTNLEFKSLDDLHKGYHDTIQKEKMNIEGISRVMIFYILNYLDDLCLIEKTIITEMENGIPRKRTKINPNVDKEVVLDELVIRGLRLSNQ